MVLRLTSESQDSPCSLKPTHLGTGREGTPGTGKATVTSAQPGYGVHAIHGSCAGQWNRVPPEKPLTKHQPRRTGNRSPGYGGLLPGYPLAEPCSPAPHSLNIVRNCYRAPTMLRTHREQMRPWVLPSHSFHCPGLSVCRRGGAATTHWAPHGDISSLVHSSLFRKLKTTLFQTILKLF